MGIVERLGGPTSGRGLLFLYSVSYIAGLMFTLIGLVLSMVQFRIPISFLIENGWITVIFLGAVYNSVGIFFLIQLLYFILALVRH